MRPQSSRTEYHGGWIDRVATERLVKLRANQTEINQLSSVQALLWLEHFGYDPGDPTHQFWKESQTVWFDDIVVATDYIGPIKK
jgi:hypothetical protein